MKAITYKLMNLYFVLRKEVDRAHCTSATTSTRTTRDSLRPKFEPEPKKTRKMQESQINSPRFSRNSRETNREETLSWAMFESFSQHKLEKNRLVPFPISTTCNVPGVWHDCCQFGTTDNIEGHEHEYINLNFVFPGTFSEVLFHLIHSRASADVPLHGQGWWLKPVTS